VREETKEMVVKNTHERRRQLRCQLDQVKEGMNTSQMEMKRLEEEAGTQGQ
jgi:hypothetical protein